MDQLPPIGILSESIGFAVFAALFAFAWAPLLTTMLYHFNITCGRRAGFDPTLSGERRREKMNTPTMGGILVIITVAIVTYIANWDRSFTWVPIGVMLLASLLGGVDDLLNIFGKARRSRKLSHIFRLIKVHKSIWQRLWYIISLPWSFFKRTAVWLSSHPGRGMHVHEKLLLQFIAGSIAAWWIFYKLGPHWQVISVPFNGTLDIGWFLVPLIILVVMFTANAVNIADGMDGLAGGMLIPTFAGLTLLSWTENLPELAILNATTVGALLAYTYFNIKPARFQMGDVGSLGLGGLLGINALAGNFLIVLPFLGFMFYVEAITVLMQIGWRYLTGTRLFRMAPLHHHFELIGWSEEKIVMRFWIVHLFFVLLGIWIGLH